MEWAIEKATGLASPPSPRSSRAALKSISPRPPDKRVERWRRIAQEAAQQSRRSDVPLIHAPAPLAERIRAASASAGQSSGSTYIVLAEQ